MKINFTDNPNKKDVDFLMQKINAENPDYPAATPFAFYIKNDDGKIIAGANGFVMFGKIYTDMLWVDSEHRNKGYAKAIMDKVHQYGKEKECTMATLSTMSFQNALGFYLKLGYKIDLERHGHTHNSTCILLRRDL